MRIIPVAQAVLLGLACSAAGPLTHSIVRQKGRIFSETLVTVARGQPVIFENDDNVPHNVMSSSPDNSFDLGSQVPGTAIPVTFDKTGVVDVICAIHPRMQMTIIVTN